MGKVWKWRLAWLFVMLGMAPCAAAEPNLIVNGSFENGMSGWQSHYFGQSPPEDASYEILEGGTDGSRALRIVNRKNQNLTLLLTSNLKPEPRRPHTFKLSYRTCDTKGAGNVIQLRMIIFGKDENAKPHYYYMSLPASAEWRTVSDAELNLTSNTLRIPPKYHKIVIPEGYERVSLNLTLAGEGEFWLDAMSLSPEAAEAPAAIAPLMEDQQLDNGKARAYVDYRQSSLRLKNLTLAGSPPPVVTDVFPTYFGYGTWNLFQLGRDAQASDEVAPGFNRLERFDIVKDAAGKIQEISNTVSNTYFTCRRAFSMLPEQPIFKLDFEWISRQENTVQNFLIGMHRGKEFQRLVFLQDGVRKELGAGESGELPFLSWLAFTDETGRNGAVFIVDNRPYQQLPQGPQFTRHGLRFPANQHRPIRKDEVFNATVYLALFRDADPVEAATEAEQAIFGESGNPVPAWRNPARPTTGELLKKTARASFWRAGAEHILSDTALPERAADAWVLDGADNEVIHEQLLFTPASRMDGMEVEFADFRDERGHVIPASSVRRFYPRAFRAYNQATAANFNGECPDLLDTVPHRNLLSGKNYSCMFSLKIPSGTAPGTYRGAVTVNGETLPLALRVRNFSLPEYPAFRADFLLWGDQYTTAENRLPGSAYRDDVRFLRLSPGFTFPVHYNDQGQVAPAVIAPIRAAVREAHDTTYRVGRIFDLRGFAGQFEMNSPEMDEAVKRHAEFTGKALKDAGVIDRLLWQLGDETHDRKRLETQAHYAALTKKTFPEIPVFTTINGWNDRVGGLLENCDIIAFHSEIYFNCVKDCLDLSGKELWQYDNDYLTATARSASVRGILWRAFRYGFKGYHHWGSMHWPKNFTPEQHGNTSGVIFYPPMEGQKSPLWSSRLVNFAAGVADYDYFVLLQKELDRLGEHPEAVKARQAFDALIRRVVPDQWNRTPDYRLLLDGRNEIADWIEKLQAL